MGFFDKLKSGLFKTKNAIMGKIDSLLKKFRHVDEDMIKVRNLGRKSLEEVIQKLSSLNLTLKKDEE